MMPRRAFGHALRLILGVCAGTWALGAGAAPPSDPGRLFFTPEQRALLEATRARALTRPVQGERIEAASQPLRYDGVLIRSDGKTTRWVDGQPQSDQAAVHGMKPGQVRADGKLYEPYQVLRQPPADKDPAP